MKRPNWKIWLKEPKECKTWLDSYLKKGILKRTGDDSTLHLKRTDHNQKFAVWIMELHEEVIPKKFRHETFYD